jgi:hypothetical protein
MNVKQLREMHRAMPFQTLELLLQDGQVLEVKSRESMAISPKGDLAVVFTDKDAVVHVDVDSIVEVKAKASRPARRSK